MKTANYFIIVLVVFNTFLKKSFSVLFSINFPLWFFRLYCFGVSGSFEPLFFSIDNNGEK